MAGALAALACACAPFALTHASASADEAPPPSTSYVPGEIVVGFENGGSRVVELPAGATLGRRLERTRRRPGVEYAVPNAIATTSFVPLDTGTGTEAGDWQQDQWSFLAQPGGIRVEGAWDRLLDAGAPGGAGVTIAVVDTGIAYAATEAGLPAPDFAAEQFVPGVDVIDDDQRPLDENGHGTHVAATIGEQLTVAKPSLTEDYLTGIAYGAKLMPVRVLDSLGAGSASDVAEGILWASRNGAEVINLSLQFDDSITGCEQIPTVCDAVRRAKRNDVLIVGAAGNALGGFGKAGALFPAAIPGILSVGATTENGCLADYSHFGDGVDIVAPGGGLPRPDATRPECGADQRPILQVTLECFPGACGLASYGRFGLRADTGTSMASAHTSAVAALVIASGVAGEEPTPEAVTKRLLCTTRPAAPRKLYRGGMLDALRAVRPKFRCD